MKIFSTIPPKWLIAWVLNFNEMLTHFFLFGRMIQCLEAFFEYEWRRLSHFTSHVIKS